MIELREMNDGITVSNLLPITYQKFYETLNLQTCTQTLKIEYDCACVSCSGLCSVSVRSVYEYNDPFFCAGGVWSLLLHRQLADHIRGYPCAELPVWCMLYAQCRYSAVGESPRAEPASQSLSRSYIARSCIRALQ